MLDHEFTRSPRDCARGALYDHGPGVFTAQNLFGDLLTPLEARAVMATLEETRHVANSISNVYKKKFARSYPFELVGISSCVGDGKGDGSYPSGHATVGIAVACVAATLFPKKAERLLERGNFHGDIRVVIGRHFPSDVEEGKRLGQQICDSLRSDPEVRALAQSIR